MTVLLALGTGFLAGRLAWVALGATLMTPALRRENHRGRAVATAGGMVVVVAVLVVEAGRVVAESAGLGGDPPGARRLAVLAAAVGFGLLGLFDDTAGSGDARGFRGHLASAARGTLTSGGVKLLGGACLGIVLVGPWADAGAGALQLVADGALVAAAANLANLFDRAPGRAGKAAIAAFAVLAVATAADHRLAAAAVVIGAGTALLLDDLRERVMLGDTGANVLGAVLGLAVVQVCVPSVRLVVLAVVLAANLASEVISFSRVIDAVPPLRALDRAGRRP
ncbi:MAG TPA: hypothetical protein VM030_09510 [Acidimicrobiales bacterium]|nr:hypothetical protein [Acidimicrobiales bacterium]